PHREEHLDLCAGYALGSLDPDARVDLEAHLEAGCPECERALADFTSAAAMMAASAQPVPLPFALKARVMNLVEATPRIETSRPAFDGAARDVTPAAVTPAAVAPPAAVTPPVAERLRVVAMPEPRRGWGFGEWALAAAAVLLAV